MLLIWILSTKIINEPCSCWITSVQGLRWCQHCNDVRNNDKNIAVLVIVLLISLDHPFTFYYRLYCGISSLVLSLTGLRFLYSCIYLYLRKYNTLASECAYLYCIFPNHGVSMSFPKSQADVYMIFLYSLHFPSCYLYHWITHSRFTTTCNVVFPRWCCH